MNTHDPIDQAAELHRKGQLDEAEALYRRVLDVTPEQFDAQHLLGGLLHQRGRHADGLALIDAALTQHVTPEALSNRGVVLHSLRRLDEALASFDKALALRPDYADAQMNQAMTRLLLGDFARGLAQYEWRWQTAPFKPAREFAQPRWRGEDLAGKTILLHAEQGLGDTIQFSRYAGVLAERGARVVLEVQPPLLRILSELPGVQHVLAKGEPLPDFDVTSPLLSLPLACGTDLGSIPAPVRLAADDAFIAKWEAVLKPARGLRVGLAWSGSTVYKGDLGRSIPLATLTPLLTRTDIRLLGLQKFVRRGDVATLKAHPGFVNISFDDFADTAGVIARLDLVITVDTAVAHLAGAMGKPVWILLPYVPDWRWLLDRDDSPWYPTARLFRQTQIGDWDDVIRRVGEALGEFAGVAVADAAAPLPPIPAEPESLQDALAGTERALALSPADAELLNRHGDLLGRLERYTEALTSFDRALASRPGYTAALNNRGNALAALKRHAEALANYDQALKLRPDYVLALGNRGNVLNELGRPEEALASYERALALAPDNPEALNNRGNALRDLGRYEEALASHDRALAMAPHYVEAMNNRGNALKELRRFDEALASYERAVAMAPGYAPGHTNLALCRLLVGDFERAWPEYEWRWKTKPYPARPAFDKPLWLGDTPLTGKTILLVAEQGFGDTIQFCRYARVLSRQGARVLLQVQEPMRTLLTKVSGVAQTYGRREPLPDFDIFCPLMSVPLALRTHLATIPADVAYLTPSAVAVADWAPRLGSGDGLRVGLVWSGNPKNKTDRQRSIPLQALAPILAQQNVRFFGLQKELRPGDAEMLQSHPHVVNLTLGDFADTAAAIAQLDLVISVDTSVAHLAGALGKAVWVLLPAAPDWRWLLDREDSPWYPTARLFRQDHAGDWDAVVARVAAALAAAAQAGTIPTTRPKPDAVALIELIQRAAAAHRAGELSEAEGFYTEVLRANPSQFDALHLRGVLRHQQGRNAEALASIGAALQVRQAPEALSNQGSVLHKLGRRDEAMASYDKAIALRPGYAEAHYNRALVLQELERHDDALAGYDQAIALKPSYAEAHYNRALLLFDLQRDTDATASLERAIAANPEYAEALNSRAQMLRNERRYDEALASHDAAVAAKPSYAEAHNSRANTLKELGRYDEALAAYDKALALRPDHAETQTNQALLRLLLGDLQRGFTQYEWRWKTSDFATARRGFTRPQWDGTQDLAERTILLQGEQGLGDSIQFCRYARDVAARGARVVLEVPPPLVTLLSRLDGVEQVVGRGEPLPSFDLYAPLMSLPHALGTGLDTIPARVPYLSAPAEQAAAWAAKLPKGLRIGLAWSGSTKNRGDRNRSIPLAALAPLTALRGITFVSIQKDLREEDRDALQSIPQLISVPLGDDFLDTAAVVANLDIVISVDTAVAHLAGAMGKPLWLLLPFSPDWRWLLDRDDSPWYPTARLFRQDRTGDWEPVIRRVTDALAALAPVRGER